MYSNPQQKGLDATCAGKSDAAFFAAILKLYQSRSCAFPCV